MVKILVVDDEPAILELLEDYLSLEGYDVTVCGDGLHGLQAMIEIRPDLVIADVMMPGMSGAPLLTAMRDNAYLMDIPVIVISGRPPSSLPEMLGAQAAFMQKPFSLPELHATIQRILAPQPPRSMARDIG